MNILPVIFQQKTFTPQRKGLNNSYVIHPNFVQSLDHDTVSFTASKKEPKEVNKNKIKQAESKEISRGLCSNIHNEAKGPAKNLLVLLKRELKNLVASEAHPENPILPGANGIKVRVKSPRSIREKALSTENHTKERIKKMGDIIGARVVMQRGTQNDFDAVFDVLGDLVKHGKLRVKEVENYRLTSRDSYVSQKTLDKFEETCTKAGQYPDIKSKAIPNGYTAIHITVILEDGFEGEIQIMGRDIEQVKEIEDFYYKLRCNKNFDPKYKSIEKIMKEKMKGFSEFDKEALNKYIKDSYIHARQLPPRSSKTTAKDFLPWPYFLPEELSYANLHKAKAQCDRAAKEAELTKKK